VIRPQISSSTALFAKGFPLGIACRASAAYIDAQGLPEVLILDVPRALNRIP